MPTERKRDKLRSLSKSPFRIVIFNDLNLHIIRQIRFNLRTLTMGLLTALIVVIIAVTVLIAFTPLREYIPGYPSGRLRQTLINNALVVDSLERKIQTYDLYFNDFKAMLAGENVSEKSVKHDSVAKPDLTKLERYNQDSVFRDKIQQEQFNLSVGTTTSSERHGAANLLFFPPLKGITTGTFDPGTGHFGIDIVGSANARISSALDGSVIFAEWTMKTGYVIMVQHDQNITTVYKHNSELLKKQGDRVRAGEAIAIMGNSGKETTGPHVHFELWIDGVAVNPADYISF